MTMKLVARLSIVIAAAAILAGASGAVAQIQLPSEPAKQFGASITGAFEGWFQNDDGSYTFLVGYLNRNRARAMDVPVGPNNRIEPGGPDRGQPTYFLPGRHTGVFSVTVSKEFTADQRLTWTLTVNGQTTSIPLRLHTDYNVSPFADVTAGNTPPAIQFEEKGPSIRGPIAALSKTATRTVAMSEPLVLTMWTSDDAKYASATGAPLRNQPPPVRLSWVKFRGPGTVTFDKPQLESISGGHVNEPFSGKVTTSARFSAPGDYVIHVTANDYSGEGGGGELCCWTTALLKVTVTR